MSSLHSMAESASRYNRRSKRSPSNSSSGYGSIVSESESEEEEKTSQHNDDQRARSPSPPVRHGEHRRLDKSNKGMMMLMKMGWTQGKGLGAQNDGRKEPIPTPAQTPLLGLGKATQDAYMLSNAISKPKELESLVIARETEEARLKREEKVKVVQVREEQRGERLKTFHCSVCDKGYTNITQFEEHERSYAHLHARRALEAKQARKAGHEPAEARREKERKREEKELRRIAMAAGVSVNAPASASVPINASASASTNAGASASISLGGFGSTAETKGKTGVVGKFKSAGFAPISNSDRPKSGFKPIGAQLPPTSAPPRFVASSSVATSFIASLDQGGVAKEEGKKEEVPVVSKFAQIAARLAAKRAMGEMKRSTKAETESTDLEKMLEGGV